VSETHAAATVALTSLSHGAGCGCKLPAAALLPIVRGLTPVDEPRLLVGSDTADDAAVFKLTDEIALVMTIDFFTPIVDDPYDFGRIAAANALSDVYAMGGVPLAAMNVVAFPLEQLGGDVLREIMRGGADVARAAGISIVGGHSIDDPEPKYGLSVTGTVHPDELISNAGARAGDVLVLTKPLGVGAITTARKRGRRDDALLARGVDVMTRLNDAASAAARAAGASAMTDVTGFGLLGHLHSLGRASGVAATIDASAVPAIDGVLELLESEDAVSGGSRRNGEYAATFTTFADDVEPARRRLICDATTSGGLLVAVSPEAAAGLPGPVVGEIVAGEPGAIAVR
jgi:selenide,water dikinase